MALAVLNAPPDGPYCELVLGYGPYDPNIAFGYPSIDSPSELIGNTILVDGEAKKSDEEPRSFKFLFDTEFEVAVDVSEFLSGRTLSPTTRLTVHHLPDRMFDGVEFDSADNQLMPSARPKNLWVDCVVFAGM